MNIHCHFFLSCKGNAKKTQIKEKNKEQFFRANVKLDSHLLKEFFICFNESPLKIMKNTFYFILKALLVLKIFKFLF